MISSFARRIGGGPGGSLSKETYPVSLRPYVLEIACDFACINAPADSDSGLKRGLIPWPLRVHSRGHLWGLSSRLRGCFWGLLSRLRGVLGGGFRGGVDGVLRPCPGVGLGRGYPVCLERAATWGCPGELPPSGGVLVRSLGELVPALSGAGESYLRAGVGASFPGCRVAGERGFLARWLPGGGWCERSVFWGP